VPSFVPVADEVYRLQTGTDAECKLFQKFAEQGHYGGITQPSNTRQGTYAVTPGGVFLASINSNRPEEVATMLRRALEKWKTLPREERLLAESLPAQNSDLSRAEKFYPKDGLVLQVHSRDLPREKEATGWRGQSWNNDFVWFTGAEARQFLPESVVPGAKHDIPESLVRRIASLHILDNVRGQTQTFAERQVEKAKLTAMVEKVEEDVATLKVEGETRTNAEGMWSIAGYRDLKNPTPQKRGIETKLLGKAKYNLKQERFVAFEMIGLGTRWGGTQYNGRRDDLAPAPIGYAFTLTEGKPAERVAPAHFSAYGWR
jgi:hypothetical protein